jgi:hypothetical protein
MPPKTPVAPQKPAPVPFWKRIPAWVYAIAAAFSIVITLAEGYPWLSIQRGEILDPNNPYSEMFEISNAGYVPLTNLSAECLVDFAAPNGPTIGNNPMQFEGFAAHLGHAETVTLPCFRTIGQRAGSYINLPPSMMNFPEGSKLNITVTYAFYHLNRHVLRRSQVFHFQSIRGQDGGLHWQFIS